MHRRVGAAHHRTNKAQCVALPNSMLTLLLATRPIDDIFFVRFHGEDLDDTLYDDRATGGSDGIYPRTLQGAVRIINMPLELTNASEGCSVHYLDYRVSLDPKSGLLVSKVYDKRDDNPLFLDQRSFPHRASALSYKCKAGVMHSQLHRFDRRSTSMRAFLERTGAYFRKMHMAGSHFTPAGLFRQVKAYAAFSPTKGSWLVALKKLRRRLGDLLPKTRDWRQTPPRPQ